MLKKTTDLKQITKLDKMIFQSAYNLENAAESNLYYLIIEQDQIVGFIILSQIYDTEYELLKIGILEQFRYLKYAFTNLKYLLEISSFSKIFLEVDSTNNNAVNLYKKLGFEISGIRKKYYQNGNDAINMVFIKQR